MIGAYVEGLPDPLLFQRFYQGTVGKPRRRFGKMLGRSQFFQAEHLSLGQGWNHVLRLVLVLILPFFILLFVLL